MFHLVTALVAGFVALRVLLPLPWPRALRVLMVVIVLLVSQHHLASRLVYGTMFSPEAPRLLMLALNWLFGAMVLAFAMQMAADIVTLLIAALRRRWRPAPVVLHSAILFASLSAAAFGVYQATRLPDVRSIEVPIADLPPQFDGYRLVQLTDLHLSKLFQTDWAEGVVARTNALQPDMIVITGDLIDGTTGDRRQDIAPLADLWAADGVHVIPGNHEYYFGYARWMDRFAELGMNVLANSHTVLRRDGAELVLAGVTDRTALRMDLPAPDIDLALQGAPLGAPVLLLDHQPRFAAVNARAGVDLQLSGHTHGGMIRGLDRIVARFNEGFVSGLYDVGDMQLYVSNGTGLWMGFAIRLGKPSEITAITLRPAP